MKLSPVLALPAFLLFTACGPTTHSALHDDEPQPTTFYVLNEAGLKNFTAGIRDALANRLVTAEFPYYDKRDIDIGDLETQGKSRIVEPVEKLVMAMENMHILDGDPTHWSFEMIVKGPATGTVVSKLYTTIFGQVIKTDVADTTYKANVDIRLFGEMNYVYAPGGEDPETGVPQTVVKIQAVCNNLQGDINDLEFSSGLLSNPTVADIIENQINALLVDNREKLLAQANASIQDAYDRGEMTAEMQEFWSVFQP